MGDEYPDILDLAPGSVEAAELGIEADEPEPEGATAASAVPESDVTFVKSGISPILLDWAALEVPDDRETCEIIVRGWETYGFGVHQIHYERCGRRGTTPRIIDENAHSSGIRVLRKNFRIKTRIMPPKDSSIIVMKFGIFLFRQESTRSGNDPVSVWIVTA